MESVAVTARTVTTTRDDYGDSSQAVVELAIPGCLFEPSQATERTDRNSPGVVTPAKFYLPVPLHMDADDEIIDTAGVTWQVVGSSSVWGDQTEVPVMRASAV